jgi:excisionase family DNA binding protein
VPGGSQLPDAVDAGFCKPPLIGSEIGSATDLSHAERGLPFGVTVSEELRRADPLCCRSVLLSEAATLLGVSRRTVYYRIRAGKLRTIRTRGGSQRALLESIEALLQQQIAGRRGAGVGAARPQSQAEALTFQV